MTIRFTPPTHQGWPIGDDYFFKKFGLQEGVSVVRDTDGSFRNANYIVLDDELAIVAGGGKVWRGGYTHEITADEQAALTAAGYGAYIEVA